LDLVNYAWYNEGMPDIQTVKEKEIQHILNMIVTEIRKYVPKEYTILLFGSWAQSNASPTSDIDIAILGPHCIDSVVMARLRQDIDELPTLRKIDVVDIQAADEKFRERILKDTIVLN